MNLILIIFFYILWLLPVTFGNIATKYEIRATVPVSVNTVGPYRNPSERYPFYHKVPFCRPHKTQPKKNVDGSVFMGDRPKLSDYILPFRENIHEPKIVCETTLDQNDIKKYIEMIHENYMFEYFVDHNLVVTGFLGKEDIIIEEYQDGHVHEEQDYYLFTHWNFYCEYNNHYVISCRITTDLNRRVQLTFGKDISLTFTYSLEWQQIDVLPQDRLLYHVRKLILNQPLDVHWLSICNSFILVILVTAFIALLFRRVLRQDCAKYNALLLTRSSTITAGATTTTTATIGHNNIIIDNDLENVDDPGWKQLQRDVFRIPNHIMLFSSAIGTGTQLLLMTIALLLLALIGFFYPGNRGAINIAIILCYMFTSSISGHVSGTLYIQLGGTKWATNALLTCILFPMPIFILFNIINYILQHYGSSMALPFSYIIGIILLYFVVNIPLTIFFAHRVRNIPAKLTVPTVPSQVPREIPKLPWYRSTWLQILLSGMLPFTAIYIELHFLFTAIFGHQIYTLYGILSLAFIMLLIVTAAVTIGLTYFQLQFEDWRWWWKSFLTAGSTGLYILGYAIFYYQYRSYMSGVLQFVYFFGYIIIVSYAFCLMLGAVGWWSTFLFLKSIYSAIKSE